MARFGTGTEVALTITPSLGISSLDLGPPQWAASSFLGFSGNSALFASNASRCVRKANYGVVLVAPADVVAMFGSMTTVGDDAESAARTMTVFVVVAVRPVWAVATY